MFRYGSLYVIEQPSDKHEINRALKQIDPRLFVEKQITLAEEQVWCVVCDIGSGEPPVTLLEFRDEEGTPIPYLTERIVHRMSMMERDGGRLAKRVVEENKRLQQAKSEAARREHEEIFRDIIPRVQGKKSALLHRGQHLRKSRDKLRNQGWKI